MPSATLSIVVLALCCGAGTLAAQRVAVIDDGTVSGPAKHGLEKLRASITAAGYASADKDAEFYVLAGAGPTSKACRTLADSGGHVSSEPQALAVRRAKHLAKPAVILCGSDARGLMYAALDAADRIGWAKRGPDPFVSIHDTTERPYIRERGISMYTMQRALFERRLHDQEYWKRYFDLLARSRINTFTIIFGYENGGFMAPLYPYFFDVPGHPEVRLVGITKEQQGRNTKALQALIRTAHERGIDVIPAVWDHIYRGGVQAGGIPGASEMAGKEVPGLVTGLTADNLGPYTQAALRRFFEIFSEIDGIEFRMHGESGLKREEMPVFWHQVFSMIARAKPGLRVTLRAKELPDSIIEDALKQGLTARIETKYWMEQMGMPFHPTHINRQNQGDRRHGYADLLKYPQTYRVLWRLWSGGTTRLLLWGDPEYVRRFAASAKLYDGDSFDVNEMLATWMLGEPHDEPPLPILNAKNRYYGYEFERYWHFYQLWGRLGYDPNTPPEVWERDFEQKFGAAGPAIMRGLHTASAVLPRIVAAAYRYQLFPTTRGWAEMMRQGDLPQFASYEGTDIEQFMNPRDDAQSILKRTATSMRRPEETSRWFGETSQAIRKYIASAKRAGASGKEAVSTLTDLGILAGLAAYYAERIPAAVSYDIYLQSHDAGAFDDAVAHEQKAVDVWASIVEAAGDVYAPELAFGVHSQGFPRHWREELARLRDGLQALEAQRPKDSAGKVTGPYAAVITGPDRNPPAVTIERPGTARQGQDLQVSVRATDESGIERLTLRYRHLTQVEDYRSVDMVRDGKSGTYVARIPGDFITPHWDIMYFVEAIDKKGNGRNYPDLEVEAPYVIVPVERNSRQATR